MKRSDRKRRIHIQADVSKQMSRTNPDLRVTLCGLEKHYSVTFHPLAKQTSFRGGNVCISCARAR